ncbi:MAG: type II toxin-antitoxin system RelE/ParE family toxin [Lachnospiraceae bacterium]|nr:type II toxin-antitoxin system RelE/ParE family toxin [Lachnospiraceae bacterium]
MYKVDFYETINGISDIKDFLEELRSKISTNKDARIQYGQISRYIELLQLHGTNLPVEIIKHIEGDIWELRPGFNRVFFFYFDHEQYVLLHHYRKKTDKTPRREINRAKEEMKDYILRKGKKNELGRI